MPGSNYIPQAQGVLDRLLSTPFPGAATAGFDQLSDQYTSDESQGIADIARRGLMNTGAVPELYTNLGAAYAKGAAGAVAQAQQQINQRKIQLLNSLLNLGTDASRVAQGDLAQSSFGQDIWSGLATGAFGYPTDGNRGGGLLSKGIYNLLSQLGIF